MNRAPRDIIPACAGRGASDNVCGICGERHTHASRFRLPSRASDSPADNPFRTETTAR